MEEHCKLLVSVEQLGQMNLCAHVPALGMLAMEWEGHPTGLRLLLEEGRCADKGCGKAGIHKSLVAILTFERGRRADKGWRHKIKNCTLVAVFYKRAYST